ncbi:RagB/SusD family nutrient uptake outer membrane protein [Dawidia soli]|uniref:RagB/SusD family nutrient uptake outer membrane protein n=1 Tax=Dawidia soli TaxID=2782352 RepID=A0AAP2GF71_9BACT|nr:RagB/SusD family nutrient uptake outer membrane protein [Dawidia soli]MBT1689182.1 RagB/SusD family nutrient uptake outer membrane protein [Dawidia soli]
MKQIFFAITILATLGACSDMLEEKPKSLAVENFYQTKDELVAAVNAIYVPIRTDGGFGINYPAQLEGMADYGYSRGSQTDVSGYKGLLPQNVSRVQSVWENIYQSIRNANLVIANIPNARQVSEADATALMAEAKYLRALLYFALVRNWKGVPLRTEANMEELALPRASIEDVYNLILADALVAEAGLPEETPFDEKPTAAGRPNKWAAKTLLAEVYMTRASTPDDFESKIAVKAEWTLARDKAQEVMSSGEFALVEVRTSEDFQKIFGPEVVSTREEIFYLKYSRQQGFGLVSYAHRTKQYYGPGGVYAQYTDTVNNPIIKNWDPADLRREHMLYPDVFDKGPTTVLYRKYRDPLAVAVTAGVGGAGNDYPWYRYADLLLFHAEAAARAAEAPTPEAMESLNQVHRRAYGYPSNTPSPVDFDIADYTLQEFIDQVVEERGFETMYEGKRWLDLKRLGIAVQRIKEVKNIDVVEKHLFWPIPDSEMLYNEALDPLTDQNPGY